MKTNNDFKMYEKVTVKITGLESHIGTVQGLNGGDPNYDPNFIRISGIGDPISVEHITKHLIQPQIESLRNLAMNAYSGISFDPEKRGQYILNDYSQELLEDIETIKKHEGDEERFVNKYVSLLSNWMSAQGRCLSAMITGPANFPVRRNEKANNSERNRYTEFREWREKALKAITRVESTDIVKGSDGALQKMEEKLNKAIEFQEGSKALNKVMRSKKLTLEQKKDHLKGLYPKMEEKQIDDLFVPDCMGIIGVPSFSLTNNNAKINNLKKDIIAEKRRAEQYKGGDKKYILGGVDVVENVEANRIQLLFDGKPEQEMINDLKRNGFRWSPRFQAWQRQLTQNGIYATKRLLTA